MAEVSGYGGTERIIHSIYSLVLLAVFPCMADGGASKHDVKSALCLNLSWWLFFFQTSLCLRFPADDRRARGRYHVAWFLWEQKYLAWLEGFWSLELGIKQLLCLGGILVPHLVIGTHLARMEACQTLAYSRSFHVLTLGSWVRSFKTPRHLARKTLDSPHTHTRHICFKLVFMS